MKPESTDHLISIPEADLAGVHGGGSYGDGRDAYLNLNGPSTPPAGLNPVQRSLWRQGYQSMAR
jgi:hypothetical protein